MTALPIALEEPTLVPQRPVFDTVCRHFAFPERIVPHPLQLDTIEELGPLADSGFWLDMGTGKTFTSTVVALYHLIQYGHKIVVILPPILLRQWARWLAEIKPSLRVCEYRGTPKERAAMSFDADFILVGIQIFKKEYDRFCSYFAEHPYSIIVDEATSVANIESDNHQKVYDFSIGHPRMLLTGTPMNTVEATYGLIKFTAPGRYRNIGHFNNLHIEERDFFKKPIKFMNLDILAESMKINSKRILFEDMYPATEAPLYMPTYYDLEPKHYKLYRKLAEEELLKLPDGGKIDATTATKLMHALGQIIINYPHFSGDPKDQSCTIDMISQKLDEMGETGKLVVFANYKMTVRHLKERLEKYGAVTINSEVTEKQKDLNVQRFIKDPKCRVIVIQFVSGGLGLDGLQHVAHHCFFAEPCTSPREFHQCVGRLKRMGQRKRVMVMMGIANGTTQIRGFKNLLKNDDLVNEVIRNASDLRNAIYGN